MFEKVNPSHPDKTADRIAGALTDMAYKKAGNPKIAIEVLIGHGQCTIIAETSVSLNYLDVCRTVRRITGEKNTVIRYYEVPQDEKLSLNQKYGYKCGDNGIFKGVPVTEEQKKLTETARRIYEKYPYDGKYLVDGDRLIICQSHADKEELEEMIESGCRVTVNPIGGWTGGINVDTGVTNRKLGSDMGDSVTGGGLFGKDFSKADVSVNIYAFLKAQKTGETVEMSCAIGDKTVSGVPFEEIVKTAREYIESIGGFEKFAEWGLIR